MKTATRVFLASILAAGVLAVQASPAGAHASMRASEPAGGSALQQAPPSMKITFTEPPDPALSSVKVTGKTGSFEESPARLAPGDESSLIVELKPLPSGSYNVTWRTVSRADGHSSAGSFNFGVGQPPDANAAPAPDRPVFSSLGAAGRWLFYLGLVGLLGASSASLIVFRRGSAALRSLAPWSWVLAAAGLMCLGASQLIDSQVGLGVFLGSSSGRALLIRAIPLGLAGLALYIFRSNPNRALGVCGLATLATMFAHAASGHAAVDPSSSLKIAAQFVHMAFVGLWIGGLAALLIGIRGEPGAVKSVAIKRFSTLAGVAIVTVAATGVLRAVHEVGSWASLVNTTYGRLVIAKAALIVVLGLLGALNRFRHVPKRETTTAGLRRTGTVEVTVAIVTLAIAGMLSSTIPPVSSNAAAAGAGPLVAEGSNFAKTARARLTVTPGTAGPNRFNLELEDFESGDPLDVEEAALRLKSLSQPELGESTLELEEKSGGRYEAVADSLSVDGRWRIEVATRKGTTTLEIPLEISTRAPGYREERIAAEGQPTIHKLTDAEERQLQVYVDPERPGKSELHLSMFGPDGVELPTDSIVVIAVPPKGSTSSLTTRRFGPGHFVSDIDLVRGGYLFDVVATTPDGKIRFLPELKI
jgi:copper transport protein